MDAVITYVNGLDPIWQQQYAKATNQPILEKRYRDWGFLPYQLRGIEVFMPFIDNVYLVVSTESQIPAWVNRENLHIVLHKDIIPAEFLPTFNSTTIELFLHNIEGLSEQFIYFNDDMFPVAHLDSTTFFRQGNIVMGFKKHYLAWDLYKQQTKQSDRFARKVAGIVRGMIGFIRPQHICTPMLRSANIHVFDTLKEELFLHITPLRRKDNLNQYLYPDYLYYTGRAINSPIPTKHCSMAVYSADGIAKHIMYPKKEMICINDVSMSEKKQQTMQAILLAAFQQRLPKKSRFEK